MQPSFRLASAGLIGLSGTSVMLAMLWPNLRGDWPFLLAASLGASGAGYLFADCFGLPGRKGVGLCLLGALLSTFTGAALAGFGLGLCLALTPAGLIFGPMAVGQALLTSPQVLLTWGISMGLAQLLLVQVRDRHFLPS